MIEDSNGKRFILRACHFERTMNQSPGFTNQLLIRTNHSIPYTQFNASTIKGIYLETPQP